MAHCPCYYRHGESVMTTGNKRELSDRQSWLHRLHSAGNAGRVFGVAGDGTRIDLTNGRPLLLPPLSILILTDVADFWDR